MPLVACLGLFASLTAAASDPIPWAYAIPPPPAPGAPPAAPPASDAPHTLEGSDRTFTLTQIRDLFGPADWFPGDHPPMPEVVARGRKPDVRACGMCHYPNGKGRPENAGVAGLPEAYFVQQLLDFRNDLRKSAEPRKANTNLMIQIAKGMTDDEMRAGAAYFASMRWTPWIRVVEARTVPKTRIGGGMFLPLTGPGAGSEPLGRRIIETPENPEHTEVLRSPRAGFIAYVPVGSIRKGEALVTRGGGRTPACAVCHGQDLTGLGPVPGLAGRSPSYTARQLNDMKQGTRRGLWADLMKPVVARLTDDDILDIAAYTASLPPGGAARRAD
jgi:cytochrome c553